MGRKKIVAGISAGDGPWTPTTEQVSEATAIAVARAVIEADAAQYNGFSPLVAQSRAEAARAHIAEALRLTFSDDIWDDSVEETARRVQAYWQELVPTLEIPFNFTTFDRAPKQIIFVGDIEFTSACVHHLLPFMGKVHVGYIPHKVQVGLSKIPRLVAWLAHRPQVQENLSAQILEGLKKRLDTSDVIVVVEAQHTCVSCRGVHNHNGVMRTSLPSGMFFSSPPARDEFFQLLARNGV